MTGTVLTETVSRGVAARDVLQPFGFAAALAVLACALWLLYRHLERWRRVGPGGEAARAADERAVLGLAARLEVAAQRLRPAEEDAASSPVHGMLAEARRLVDDCVDAIPGGVPRRLLKEAELRVSSVERLVVGPAGPGQVPL